MYLLIYVFFFFLSGRSSEIRCTTPSVDGWVGRLLSVCDFGMTICVVALGLLAANE